MDVNIKTCFFLEIMENMNNGLTVPKWVLIVWPKLPQMPHNLSGQFVCPSSKVLDFNEKKASFDVRSPSNKECKIFYHFIDYFVLFQSWWAKPEANSVLMVATIVAIKPSLAICKGY